MRVLQVMAGKSNGGAELYSTDVMLSLHAAGIEQCVAMRRAAPRFAELEQAGLRLAAERLRYRPPPLAAPADAPADRPRKTRHHPLLDAPRPPAWFPPPAVPSAWAGSAITKNSNIFPIAPTSPAAPRTWCAICGTMASPKPIPPMSQPFHPWTTNRPWTARR